MRYVNNSKVDTEERLNEIKNAGHIYLKVTCHDKSTGTAFDIGEDDVSMEGFQLTTILNPEVDIHYGEAISSEIQLNLLRTDDVSRIDWRDEITVSLGYEKNNNIIWDVIGTYYGSEPSQLYSKTKVITFVGYDKMTKYGQILADDLIANIPFPTTNYAIMSELETQLGITITEEAPRLFEVRLEKGKIPAGATIRDILAWLAEVNGENAVKSVYADEVKYITYSKPKYSVDYTLTTDDYFTMDRSDVYVQSVPCLTFSDTANTNNNYRYPPSATGVPYTIVNNPFFIGLDNNDKDLVASMTLEYRLTFDNNHDIPSFIPMKVDAIGNYMVEAGDVINIVDEDNNTLPLVIFSRTLTWTGGFLRDEYECTGGTERQEMSSTERELYSVQKIVSNSISDNLVTNSKDMALSANQGKVLDEKIEGTPTIISNANGTAYQFPSGLMICTKSVQKNMNINSGWGNLYEGSVALGDWAVPFISNPIVSVQNANSTGAIVESGSSNATSAGTWYFCRPNAVSNVSVDIHAIAYGRWK